MKRILLFVLLLAVFGIVGCDNKPKVEPGFNSQAVDNQQDTGSSEQILVKYHAFRAKFDAANIGNMRVELTKPAENQKNYQIIKDLLAEAESVHQLMVNELATKKDLKTQAQLRPYIDMINARIMTLKSNKATFQSFGAS